MRADDDDASGYFAFAAFYALRCVTRLLFITLRRHVPLI